LADPLFCAIETKNVAGKLNFDKFMYTMHNMAT